MLITDKQLIDMRALWDSMRNSYLGYAASDHTARVWFDTTVVCDIPEPGSAGRPVIRNEPKEELLLPISAYGAGLVYGIQLVPYPDYADVRLRVWGRKDVVALACFIPSVADSGRTIYVEPHNDNDGLYPEAGAPAASEEITVTRQVAGTVPAISSTWASDAKPFRSMLNSKSVAWDALRDTIIRRSWGSCLCIDWLPLPPGATEKRVPDCDDLMSWWQTCGLIRATDWQSTAQMEASRGYRPTFINSALGSRDAVGVTGVNGPPSPAGILLPHNWEHGIGELHDTSTAGVNLASSLNHAALISIDGCPGTNWRSAPTQYASTHTDSPGHAGPEGPSGPDEVAQVATAVSNAIRTYLQQDGLLHRINHRDTHNT
jgi:hypothetical protein